MIELILAGEIVPKARPRVTARGTFMPHRYREWKDGAILALRCQYHDGPLAKVESIAITLEGKHSRRSDGDNIAGSVLDALVQASILANDNLLAIPKLSIELQYNPKALPTTKISIESSHREERSDYLENLRKHEVL
jgi:Holliday junction resolvase RusA-like endonuclease